MIIWGFRWREKTLSSGVFFCPHCNANRPYKRKRAGYYFSLFFLPLIPVWKKRVFVECQECQSRFDPAILRSETQGTLELVAATRYALLHGISPLDARSNLMAQGIDGHMADRVIEMAQR